MDLDSVDFKSVNLNERTIFQACFNIYLAYPKHHNIDKLCKRLETVFLKLMKSAASNMESNQLKSLLEKPDGLGRTVAFHASKFSEAIMSALCSQNISMNQITANFEVIELNFPELAPKMIELGVNTRIVNLFGKNQHNQFNSLNQEGLFNVSLKNPKSILFSLEDESCDENCTTSCPADLRRFIVKEGIFLDPKKAVHVGAGSSGNVYKGKWHSVDAAFKFIEIPFYATESESIKSFNDLQENFSEFIHQRSIEGHGVLQPIGLYRQQIQKKKTPTHFNVIVYPLCDCNLYQLLENDRSAKKQIDNILNQCLIRKL